ncbi:sugar phosphate nucleotidyltransferase [Paenibacillus sp. JX-17]|uniref:Sugar phosphate nucleotidyltransferase n=1 Tax=Paenibacillus lacisoli TaxID=3064525 RepID=A0ABT9CG87_9BACL|nr:sugar phosphate nucleotidyltransferase [Paenibacillus sp. JX-17]MDO7908286.1 sugar phosphate nucleotidyltransferase [Paenibacillus sp. JX-17]
MHIVLLCGGSGKRLWPLSNEIRSKLFLEVLPAPGGGYECMLSRVLRQLESAGLLNSTLLVTHSDQAALASAYAGNRAAVLAEPHKRGTFTATVLAALALEEREEPEDGLMCVVPADTYADDRFWQLLGQLPKVLETSGADIALLGTEPTQVSSQFGYIVPEARENERAADYKKVARFAEKPSPEEAARLINEGALWNCGVFVFRRRSLGEYIQRAGLPLHAQELLEQYEKLPVRSFDQEVVERSRQIAVVRYAGEWQDLGSWSALTAKLAEPVTGKGLISGSSPNSHIVNELPFPLHIINVPDIIAAASRDGILIAAKEEANRIKDLLGQEQQDMLFRSACPPPRPGNVETSHLFLRPGQNLTLGAGRTGSCWWLILKGAGTAGSAEGGSRPFAPGQVLRSEVHPFQLSALQDTELLEIRFSPEL